ncbi:MAG: response regulator [Candidatus Omnitrophota bacterium]|nr:response regulator [Candidatus Omnitrophota bacterium]
MVDEAAKKKILIIDDEEDFTKLVKMNLEAAGEYEVRAEREGIKGIAAAKEFKPNLIFLDILMSDMEGGEVAYQLDNDPETGNIPIVFLTAVAKKEEVREGKGVIGGHPFMAKPVTTAELIQCIEENARRA